MNEVQPVPASEFEVGESVYVHAFGHWYLGQVVKVSRKRVSVQYTNGVGNTRTKTENPETIRFFTAKNAMYETAGSGAVESGPMVRKLSTHRVGRIHGRRR